MSILSNSIKDNLNRNLENQKLYIKQLNNLPKGKIVKRKKRNGFYYYLEYRDGVKVKYKYLGSVVSFNINDIEKALDERKIVVDRLSRLKQEEKEMKKILHVIGDNH